MATMTASAAPATVDIMGARAALAAVVPRLADLVRSIRNPAAPALGEWSTGEVAVHLAHVWERLPALAAGESPSPINHPSELAALTVAMVRGDSDCDLETAARRIEAGAAAYLATPIDESVLRPWVVAGVELPASCFACHLLNESLVHGWDIAHAERRPWRIEPAHAGMAMFGFLLHAMSSVDPRFPVDQQAAAGVRACYDVRVRNTGRFFLMLDNGEMHIEPPSDRPVDWHVSADATALFLAIWSRIGLSRPLLTGRMIGWGRNPRLGMRLSSMLRNP